MSKQSWEHWQGYEDIGASTQQPRVAFEQVVSDPIQRRVVEVALMSGADVDPRVVRAMGMEAGKGIVDASDIAHAEGTPGDAHASLPA